MGLSSQFFEGKLGVFHRFALRTESGVTQTWRAAHGRTVAVTHAGAVIATRRTVAEPGLAGITPTAPCILTVAKFGRSGICGSFLLHTGTVVSAHRHHRLGSWLGSDHRRYGGRGLTLFSSCFDGYTFDSYRRRFRLGRHRIFLLNQALCCLFTGACRGHIRLGLGLTVQRSVERCHGCADGGCIARGVGSLQGLGSIKHRTVACTQGSFRFFTVSTFAIKGIVNGLAEGIPQLLLLAAIDRDRVGLGLPALLQGFDRIDPQYRHGTELLGLFDHGLAGCKALCLNRLQRSRGFCKSCFPQGLQLGKHFFAHMACFTPTVGKLVQDAIETFPVIIQCGAVCRSPRLHLFNKR